MSNKWKRGKLFQMEYSSSSPQLYNQYQELKDWEVELFMQSNRKGQKLFGLLQSLKL